DVVLFSGVTAHYIQDAHQPLHAIDNYDGQLTGQRGLHGRFETELFDRYSSRLNIVPGPVVPIRNPDQVAWDVLLVSYTLVDGLLQADKQAVEGREFYDDAYFDALFDKTKPMLERRLSEAIAATAGAITGAWIDAGRPAVPVKSARPLRKVLRDR